MAWSCLFFSLYSMRRGSFQFDIWVYCCGGMFAIFFFFYVAVICISSESPQNALSSFSVFLWAGKWYFTCVSAVASSKYIYCHFWPTQKFSHAYDKCYNITISRYNVLIFIHIEPILIHTSFVERTQYQRFKLHDGVQQQTEKAQKKNETISK